MPVLGKIDGAWQNISQVYCKLDGVWRNNQPLARIGGTWQSAATGIDARRIVSAQLVIWETGFLRVSAMTYYAARMLVSISDTGFMVQSDRGSSEYSWEGWVRCNSTLVFTLDDNSRVVMASPAAGVMPEVYYSGVNATAKTFAVNSGIEVTSTIYHYPANPQTYALRASTRIQGIYAPGSPSVRYVGFGYEFNETQLSLDSQFIKAPFSAQTSNSTYSNILAANINVVVDSVKNTFTGANIPLIPAYVAPGVTTSRTGTQGNQGEWYVTSNF